ncbi:MAG: hypothetical protein JSU74_05255 [Candidatus Zixiibacteriota bacterium]|nr:MAG: hypothetical protein JSU74_05255 [candidate division Zixibacteria bacterium]
MKNSLILLSVLILLTLNVSALAQDDEEDYERDVLEINFFGGLDAPTGEMLDWKDTLGAKAGFNFGLDLGYFVKEQLVAGFGFRFGQYSIDAADADLAAAELKHRLYNPHLYVKYYLMPYSDISPYLKANAGLTFLKFTTWVSNENGDRYRQLSYDPAYSFGIGGGIFLFTADYGGLFVEGNYHHVSGSSVEAEYEGGTYSFDEDISAWDFHLGLRILVSSGG